MSDDRRLSSKMCATALAALMLPAIAYAQASDVPSGSPLGTANVGAAQALAQVQAQVAMQARQRAATQARINAQRIADASDRPRSPAVVDEGRPVATTSTFGQADVGEAPARATPSPYGGYYQIRTPWDRR